MLQAGFARLDMTPPLGTALAGYFHKREMKGILDPLFINAIALTAGEEKLIIITVDLLALGRGRGNAIRQAIEEKTGVPANSVIIQALHQHTAPRITEVEGLNYTTKGAYHDLFMQKVVDAAVLALNDAAEAALFVGEEEVPEKISFVRRYWMKSGIVETNPGFSRYQEIDRPCDEPDNTVHLLRFKREKGDIALVNFACHPDVIGGERVSADWPGFVRRYVEADHPGASCIFCNGFQGDSNHHYYQSGVAKRGITHSSHMGRVVADTVAALWEKVTPMEVASVGAKMETVYTRTRTEGIENYEKCKAWYAADEAEPLGYKPHITELAANKRVVALRTAPIFRPVVVSVGHIGDVMLAGLGGEPFTYYIRAAKAVNPDKMLLTFCLANGDGGYFPTAKAFEEGGYEASSSPFTPALEGEIVSTIEKLMKA